MSVKPIRPGEVTGLKQQQIPDYVIEAFNECISRAYSGGIAVVYQDSVIEAILHRARKAGVELLRQELFDRRYLDVESIFEKAGWKVTYDKPGYNESYKAFFEFKKKR